MSKFKDLTGQKFGKLTVIKRAPNNKNNRAQWYCNCDCGKENIIVLSNSLLSGRTLSCGCLQKERTSKAAKENNKKYNTYDLSGEFGIGYTTKGEPFYFDLEDYELIKNYCWCYDKRKYVVTVCKNTEGKRKGIKFHQLVTNFQYKEIDHENNKKWDNRKINLRPCTHEENMRNVNKKVVNKSGYIGVIYYRNKWVSSIYYKGKLIHLGTFEDKEQAIIARLKAEKEYYKDFAPQKELFKQYNI